MNTHPNTPFGKFLFKRGLWHETAEETIVDLYDKLHDGEKVAAQTASGWIAVINEYLPLVPASIFDKIQEKFPGISEETITEALNKVNTVIAGLTGIWEMMS
jgi:hypothetical protein